MNSKKHILFFIAIVIVTLAGWKIYSLKKQAGLFWKNNGQIPFVFSEQQRPVFPDNTCTISDYGAISDGTTLNTQAFQKAISDCAQKGGGKVFVPAGLWLSGAIHLESNINLHIDKDAKIIFSTNPSDYLPFIFTRIEGMELYNYSPFIYANGAQNFAITGKGMLDGQGDAWQSWKKGEANFFKKLDKMVKENISPEKRFFSSSEPGLRPSFMQFVNCQNVWLEDFSITQSPRWTIQPVYCENVSMRNLNIQTTGFNSDGIVIDSSKNVLVENSFLSTGDDTIAIKSGLNEDGWRVNRPSENIIVRNCEITDGHSAIAIGSEMSGGVRNVYLTNLRIDGADQGIRVKSVEGRGGFVENIWVDNISMGNITNVGLKFDMNYPASTLKPREGNAPTFKNFYIDEVTIEKTKLTISLEGLTSSQINNVSISNIKASSEKGVFVRDSRNIDFDEINISGMKNTSVFDIKNSQNINY